jgi:hypothetical protein
VHPFLALSAATAARWRGSVAFHAGGPVVAGKVWGLLGSKGVGKSTTMAQLVAGGVPVMTDDVLIVADGEVLAGPRCLDLREETARHFALGEPLGVVGARARWRVPLDEVPPSLPLGGFVQLAWDEDEGVDVVPAAERLPLLASSFTLRIPPPSWDAVLSLCALPVLRLRRPQRLDGLARAVDRLLVQLGG